MVIRAVIFDLDGTLVDHLGAQREAYDRGMTALGIDFGPAGPDAALALWRQLERRHMDEFLAGACTFTEQRRRRLAAFLRANGRDDLDDVATTEWWAAYSRHYEAAWMVYPDAERCVAALRARVPRLRLGVLTNGDTRQQRAKLARFGLLDAFDGVYVSDAIGAAKPDPRSYRAACDGLGVAPEETLFVGDIPELDVVGPTRSGLIGVWLDRFGQANDQGLTRIESLNAIPAMLEPTRRR